MNVQDLADLREAIAFFVSAIKSGEEWSDECERQYQAVKAILDRAEIPPVSLSSVTSDEAGLSVTGEIPLKGSLLGPGMISVPETSE